ncbi:MAG: Amuc_1102 family pilus-like protein [Prosthecobacter sp.]
MKSLTLALSIVALALPSLQAQTKPAVKVDIKAPKVSTIQTPQFQASNVPDKSWRPKDWLEIDMEFDIKLATTAGGRNGSLASMTVNFYLGMNAKSADGKFQVMKGSFDYVDIPASEKCHALAFITPATLRRVLLKDGFTAGSDIKAWGVEVLVDGQRVAGETSTGKAWWEDAATLNINDAVMLAKKDTPFAILWGDYDVGVKNK